LADILLFGPDGQVGWELQRSLIPLGTVRAFDWREVDFRDSDQLRRAIRKHSPDVIVNAAAHTAVDKAESERDSAMAINGTAVEVLAQEAERSDAILVHYSTDYVFNGDKDGPYTEEDMPAPLNVYGETKLHGERAIQASGCKHLVFRTSWVYGPYGGNFARTILRLARERDRLKVIDDQIGAPTSAELLADITASSLAAVMRHSDAFRVEPWGLYHLTAAGHTSWHGYAKFVVETAARSGMSLKLTPENIESVPSSEFVTAAKRPLNSRLATAQLTSVFGFEMPHWQFHLKRLLTETAAAEVR
jgi:dTDP-4-dehydrorhamnose reductase